MCWPVVAFGRGGAINNGEWGGRGAATGVSCKTVGNAPRLRPYRGRGARVVETPQRRVSTGGRPMRVRNHLLDLVFLLIGGRAAGRRQTRRGARRNIDLLLFVLLLYMEVSHGNNP